MNSEISARIDDKKLNSIKISIEWRVIKTRKDEKMEKDYFFMQLI